MLTTMNQYEKVKNCHTGEIDGFGYALVPGNKEGLVLLDLNTKRFLDNLPKIEGGF